MYKECMLAYDLGTSGVKTSVIGADGTVTDTQTEAYQTHYGIGGIAEQDALSWWNGVCVSTNKIIERSPQIASAIVSIGVSGHMLGCLAVDEKMTPLLPHMIHSDSRAYAQYRKICDEIGADQMYEMSGNILDARSSLCKILWIKENRPDIYGKTAKFMQSKDFIVSRLTGNTDTTDYSDACHGELMDIRRKQYDPGMFSQLKLDIGKMPALHKGCDIVGFVTEEAAKQLGIKAGTPVIAGGGDGACGSAGAANTKAGDAYLNLGTTAWIAAVTDEPVIDPGKRVFNIVNLDGETSSVYGAMQSAGSSVNWICSLLGMDLKEMNALAASARPGCDGLIYLPYLDGERSPVFDPNAGGVFAGMNQSHGRAEFARAVFEGTAYALRQIADIQREFIPLTSVRAIGGGIRSALWMQIIADITHLNLQKLSVPAENATSLGVAAVAGTAVGLFDSMEDALAHIRISGEVHPETACGRYEMQYRAYKEIYPAMKGVMHMLRDGNETE